MSDFTREIKIYPSYDYRDEPGDQRGAHGADMVLILRGPLGVIAAKISTGWMAFPLAGSFIPGREQRRRSGPGLDAGGWDIYPSGSYVGYHTLHRGRSYDSETASCEYLGGETCYGDGSYTASDEVLRRLVAGGSDLAFEHLEQLYQVWIAAPESGGDGS